jgi:FMN phosphatase YigB (HAD superfamily)
VSCARDTPAWVFFDCFNTLVQEGEPEEQWGLGGVAHIPVEAGLFESVAHFRRDYEAWHRSTWDGTHWREVPLPDRLVRVLQRRASSNDAAEIAQRMLDEFERSYIAKLRPMSGVEEMLASWGGVAPLAVV